MSDGEGGGAGQALQQVQEKASDMTGTLQDKAGQATGSAQERIRDEVDRRTNMAGEQVRSLSDVMRQTGEGMRDQGREREAGMAEQAADRAERLAGYLERADADTLLQDVEEFGRRQPWALAAGGLAIGFLAARFVKASSHGRYAAGQSRSSYGQWERQLPTNAQLDDPTSAAGAAYPRDVERAMAGRPV